MTNIHSYVDVAASHQASPRGASFEALAPVARTDLEGDVAAEFARVAFVHWRQSVAAPTAWSAERFFDRFVATSRPCREPPEGAALEVARARFAALVQPLLLPPLEQAMYLSGELPDVTDPSTIEESLERIDDLLAVHGGGVPIEAIVETHRVTAYARRLVGFRISRRLDEARWAAGASRTPPVHDTDPLDPVQYAGWTLAHWLADDGLWAPTASNAQQYFGFFTNTSGRYRNPHEGEETDETFERYMELVGAHLADHLGHARHVAARLSGMGTVADVERRLDAIELLLEKDGRRLALTDVVRLDSLPPLARDVVLRRHAARRAAEAGPTGASVTAPATGLRTDGAAPSPRSGRDRRGGAADCDVPVADARCGPDPESAVPMSKQTGRLTDLDGRDAGLPGRTSAIAPCRPFLPATLPIRDDAASSDTGVDVCMVYLIVDGIAGSGAINGECFVQPLPTDVDELAALLLGQAAHELGMRAADRCNAMSLGELTTAEIAMIPDRPAALSAWFVEVATRDDPSASGNLELALDELCRRDERRPDATFAVDTVRRHPRGTAEFLLCISETMDGSRTRRSPASSRSRLSAPPS